MRTPLLCVVLLLTSARAAGAPQVSPTKPPPPPPPDAPQISPSTPPPLPPTEAPQISPSTPPLPPPDGPTKPVFDPLHAEKSMEVGTFYLKKGKYDAAIDRFEDATRFQPSLAKPWRLLGEAYEKKQDYGKALESYKKYMQLFPGAEDGAKVTKRIAALEEKLGPQSSQEPAN